jgi:polyribonucleotide nucleotidyltransferase
VKLLGFDDRGKVRLSMKVVDQATGEDLSAQMGEEAEDRGPRRDRGDRGPRRDRGERRERREASGE